jgi:hypothetical protein
VAQGDIVLNMVGNNQLSGAIAANVSALGSMNGAIDRHISKLVQQTRTQQALRIALRDTDAEQAKSVAISGRAQGAINNLVFAVDDATTVYGQQGWAGAIRAASNNLTFAAAALGPWGAAIAVGVSAVTQLTLALSDNESKAKKNTEALASFRREVEAIQKTASRIELPEFRSGDIGIDEFGQRSRDVGDRLGITRSRREFLQGQLGSLEQRRSEFAVQNTTNPNDVMRGLSDTDRQTYEQMTSELDRLRGEISDLTFEEGRLTSQAANLRNNAERVQQEQADEVGAAMERENRRLQREEQAEQRRQEQERGSIQKELQRDMLRANPFGQDAARQFDIVEQLRQRETGINALTNVDPAIRQQMLRDAEAVAARQLGGLEGDRTSLSSRGPQTLRRGEADTFRFLAQARLGTASQTPEVRKLAAIEANGRAMLAELRKGNQMEAEAEPVEVVDF